MNLTPSWAFSGQAVMSADDAHLAPGLHYRVLTNPLLGLPVVPLAIGKVSLGKMAKGHTREDVTWVDSQGRILAAPFHITPDNPVTGYLPPGWTCCWAVVHATADPVRPHPQLPGQPPAFPPFGTRGRFGTFPGISGLPRPELPPGFGTRPPRTAAFQVEGVVATAYGDAPVAIRSRAPYHVYASHLERIVVRGSGTVNALSWLPAEAVTVFERFRLAPLPTSSGARYAGPADGADEGMARVKRGAPQRLGMHESPLATSPTACTPVPPDEELARVDALARQPADTLDRLINDMSAAPHLLTAAENLVDANGTTLGSSQWPIIMDLLQGVVDPGIARWLGFLDLDQEPPQGELVVVAYVVDALFAPDWRALEGQRLDRTLSAGTVHDDGVRALRAIAERAPGLMDYADEVKRMRGGPFLTARVVLAATTTAPLDPPGTPTLGTSVPGDWLPAPPPAATRELMVGIENLVPAAGLASAMAQPVGGRLVERNPKDSIGRRLLLTAQPSAAAVTATSGELADRLVDEQPGTWQVAQLDWFGRWSSWAARNFASADRPRPPRPVITLTTRPPTVPTPAPAGPLAGSVRVEVSVPPVAGLPAGGRLLAHLQLTVRTDGGPLVTTVHPVPNPSAPPEVLVLQVPGPALLPTRAGPVTVTAVWTDSAGVDSDPSEPRNATLHDPRPPAPVVIAPTLTYTARPDATGRARATLTWTPSTGQAAYRVFVADETTLRAKVADAAAGRLAPGDAGQAPAPGAAQTLLAALDAAPDAPSRGAAWDAHRHLLPRRWWLQLTADPLPRPTSGPAAFTHEVSGSLTVLVLYRVVAVSAASVESDFATSPLLPRAVPNQLVPPVPTLEVQPVVDPTGNLQALLTVTVPVGPTPAAQYRLRRATATSDPTLMPIVGQGPVPARPAGEAAAQAFEVIDTGDSPGGPRASLSAWLSYTWRVEVQGPPAPGGGPVAEWSGPSAAVATTTMPPGPPEPAADLSVTRDAAEEVHVRFSHPQPLAGGATTGYTVDVYRQLLGQPLRLLRSLPGQEPPPVGRGADVTGTFDVDDADPLAVAGTRYRVVVTDPIGRSSSPSDPQEAP